MHSSKILILLAIGLLCANARVLKKKFRQRISCGCPIQEPTYGCLGTCKIPSIYLDELSCGGCQYTETYGVLNPELPNYGRVPAIKLPKMPLLPYAACDPGTTVASVGYEVLPAINLPGVCDVLPLALPCVNELPCPSPCQCVGNCGCKVPNQYELPSPILSTPVDICIRPPKCLPQALQLPLCGCQTAPCLCQKNPCSCQPMTCGCQPLTCECQPMTCGCQRSSCGCQRSSCGCQRTPCGCQNVPCSCQNSCECQNVYVSQLQALPPCACQSCQLPLELPLGSCGCQLPSPVIGCGGKYLRQVVIQPPFL